MKAIEIKNLTKTYGKVRGVVDLSITVEAGEFFGFIGPNGAGKSTTIRTLLGFIKPTSGSAFVLDKNITNESVEIKKRTGYLPSEVVLYPKMKVKDILKLSARLRNVPCEKTTQELCERLLLDVNRRVCDLSFGNRKKVGIVCALQHESEILILDEPTSGLDPLMQAEFFKIIRERNQKGTTVFLSSHVLSEVQHNCTRAAIIRDGSIIACDTVENLSKNNAKRVTLHYDNPRDVVDDLSKLEGVKNYFLASETVQQFLYSGRVDLLLHELSKIKLSDLTISEPDLEEVFIYYYK